MNLGFVQSLPITDVDQRLGNYGLVEIMFKINGFEYNLFADQYKRGYLPGSILHVEKKEICSFCRRPYGFYDVCEQLSEYTEELFAYLKTFKSIRLHWLFLN